MPRFGFAGMESGSWPRKRRQGGAVSVTVTLWEILWCCLAIAVPAAGADARWVVSVICDGANAGPSLRQDRGFACLVAHGDDVVLFDTGGHWQALETNLSEMNVDSSRITHVVVSHHHPEAVGGLLELLESNPGLSVACPFSSPQSLFFSIEERMGRVVAVGLPCRLGEGIYSTGELGYRIKEHALILDTPPGLVILTGCAHPGITTVVAKARESLKKPVYLVMGGFHLAGQSDDAVLQTIEGLKELGATAVGPSHCTGDRAIELFQQAFEERCLVLRSGCSLSIPETTDASVGAGDLTCTTKTPRR